jgi:hypothetical protein
VTAPALDAGLGELTRAVQRNCDLADAYHAREASLCTYLLGMREFYRWHAALPLGAPLPRDAVGRWIAEREATWDELRRAAPRFCALPLAGGLDAFDEAGANAALAGRGLLYGAGVGRFGAPLFFLAEIAADRMRDGARVLIAEREHARGLHAPPALARGGTIVVRKDALRRWLWTQVEGAQRRARDDALAQALRLQPGATLAERVAALAEQETESLVLHELGELRAGRLLGAEWEAMLAAFTDRRAELAARAVRDLLADTLVTLPALSERAAAGALHAWFAHLDGMRRALAPELAALHAPDFDAVRRRRLRGEAQRQAQRWQAAASQLLDAWRADGVQAAQQAALALTAAASAH